MNILLHTIALEPNRWTPARVSRPLADLLPAIDAAGFRRLEIFEPHLTMAPDENALPALLARHHLTASILSSYLDLSPAVNPPQKFDEQVRALQARLSAFGFAKVRLFPGRALPGAQTSDTIRLIASRLQTLTDARPDIEFLLETHDGSLADDPACMLRLVEACARPNLGLLWQPTVFEENAARAQFALQKPYIRHIHLQNRTPDLKFTRLAAGVIPWADLLRQLPAQTGATLEFVTGGLTSVEEFDLDATLVEATEEAGYVTRICRLEEARRQPAG